MTETEWLHCKDAILMIEQLTRFGRAKGKQGQRKLRLFVCACCRRQWELLPDERSQHAVEVSERFADGRTSLNELRDARQAAQAVCDVEQGATPWILDYQNRRMAVVAREATLENGVNAAVQAFRPSGEPWFWWGDRFPSQALRDLFGNPYRPVAFDQSWQTPTSVGLARTTYEARDVPAGTLDPNRLAVLADALEDAGCDNTDILEHLRSPGPHVRGCWALDLVLDKR